MQLSDAINRRIRYFLDINNMSVWDLYKSTGIPKSTLCAIMDGSSKVPKTNTILHICEGFWITIREFFNDKIFDNVEQD